MATLSTTTFKQADAQARALSGATDYSNPNQTTSMSYANKVLSKMARLLNPIQKPWGRSTATLTNLASAGFTHALGDGGSYSVANKTLSSVSGLDQTYVGGWAFIYDAGGTGGYLGLIDTVNSAGTSCTMRTHLASSGSASDPIASASLLAILKPNPAFYPGANLGSINVFDVVKVVDATNGNAVRLSSKEFASFSSNPNYDDSVVMEYAGESVFLGLGANLSSFGTLTITYDEKPTVITAITDTIDLPEEYIDMFINEHARWLSNHISKPVSPQLEHPLKVLEAEFMRTRKEIEMKARQQYRVAERRGR